MSATEFSITSSYGGEVLHFPVETVNGSLQMQPPLEAAAATVDQVASSEQVQASPLLDTLLEPSVYLPAAVTVTAVVTALGTAKVSRWRKTKAERAELAQRDEEMGNLPAERVLSHNGGMLVVDNVLADVHVIQNHTGDDMSVAITGRQKRLRGLSMYTEGDQLIVRGPTETRMEQEFLDIPKSLGGKRLLRWLSKRAKFEIVTPEDIISIVASVPGNTDLDLHDIEGSVNVLGKMGDVNLKTSYESQYNLATVGSAIISAEDESAVSIRYMRGNLDVEAGYNTSIKILEGRVDKADIRLQDEAEFVLGTEVEELKYSAGYESKGAIHGNVLQAAINLQDSARLRVNGTIGAGQINVGYDATVSAHRYEKGVERNREYGGHIRTHKPGR